ncbi:MAG: flagellar basal body rod protein FlgB [Deltaproteobacteria bacterium]|jgi:flagellar basal-body rod protein FlgB|nr:flagellar basal body rod protein FlgB [Deltaproteobacteria bacterium]
MKSLHQPHLELVGKVMDMQMQRQNVLMSNVANVNTPRYQRRTLEFEEALQAALGLDKRGKMSRTDEHHMPAVFDPNGFSSDWTKGIKPRVAHGEDRVNLDKEMTRMAKNTLQYNALSQVIKSGFDSVKNVIQEGQK